MQPGVVFPFVIALIIALASPASAQTGSSSIAGVVRDQTGAALPGVTVEAASPSLIEKMKTTVTNEAGEEIALHDEPERQERDDAKGMIEARRDEDRSRDPGSRTPAGSGSPAPAFSRAAGLEDPGGSLPAAPRRALRACEEQDALAHPP